MIVLENRSFRLGMESLVANNVKAVVMGQRSVDPWMKGMDAFTPSTDGWPAFMRINPIMKWSYHHVWIFLRQFGFPYCELYDQGFTSLGSVKDTLPNPALKRSDGSFAPAYELEDGTLERDGRTSSKSGKVRWVPQKPGWERWETLSRRVRTLFFNRVSPPQKRKPA